VVLFQLGPSLIKIGLKDENEGYTKAVLQEIHISTPNETTTTYLTFDFIIDNNQYKRIFRVSDRKHIKILDFLISKNLLSPQINKYKIEKTRLPINIQLKQISTDQNTYILLDETNNLISIIINDQLILGNKNGFIKKTLAIISGITLILLVGTLFIFTLILLVKNCMAFSKTGTFPELPNSIVESLKGWRIIFRKRK
jgi:hypothetical protein